MTSPISPAGTFSESGTTRHERGLASGFLRPRVGLVVNLGQVGEVEVGVDLGGRQVGVAEQFLHGPEVAGRFQDVRGERVPQLVRGHVLVQALADGALADALLDRADAQGRALGGGEDVA